MELWKPHTEEDLRVADANGMLEESLRYEFKAQLGKPGGSANAELARDLASLAVEGGLLIVGIKDIGDRPPTLAPLDTSGLAERVGQIASMRCDPPLFVETHAIPSEDQPGLGYLVVIVPPSPLAPHMVDGRYWTRDDRTRRQLTDHEVAQILSRRDQLKESAERELEDFIARDPVPTSRRQLGHFYGVAVPLAARRGQLRAAIDTDHPMNDVRAVVFHHDVATPYSPNLGEAGQQGRRHDGWAFASRPSLAQFQEVTREDGEKHLISVEISEEGVIRLLNGRATDKTNTDASYVLIDQLIVGMTSELVSIAGAVGQKMGYLGAWALGVALRGPLRGLPAATARELIKLGTPFGSDSYTEFTQASTSELANTPGIVGSRLIGRFMRSLDMGRSPQLLRLLGLQQA